MLLYQGQLDVRDGVAATEAWLANWSWTGRRRLLESPRKAGCLRGAAATTGLRGLTHLTVNAAGHLRPHDAPAQRRTRIGRASRAPSRNSDMCTRMIENTLVGMRFRCRKRGRRVLRRVR